MPAHLALHVIAEHANSRTQRCRTAGAAVGILPGRALFAFVLIATLILWASAYVAIPIALEGYAPGQLAAFRQILSVAITLPVFLLRPKGEVAGALKQDWRPILAMAFLGIGLYHIMLSTGQRTVGPGMASLLINLSPIITAIVAGIYLNETMGRRAWIGGAVAFAGAAALVLTKNSDFSIDLNAAFVIIATASQSVYFVIQRHLSGRYSPILLALLTIWLGGAMLLPFGSGTFDAWRQADISATLAVVYLGCIAGVWPYFGWAWVLARVPTGKASVWLYTIPAISIGLGWAILGETPTPALIASGVVILAGVALANSRAANSRQRTALQEDRINPTKIVRG